MSQPDDAMSTPGEMLRLPRWGQRIGTREREEVVRRLMRHQGKGRLTAQEYMDRAPGRGRPRPPATCTRCSPTWSRQRTADLAPGAVGRRLAGQHTLFLVGGAPTLPAPGVVAQETARDVRLAHGVTRGSCRPGCTCSARASGRAWPGVHVKVGSIVTTTFSIPGRVRSCSSAASANFGAMVQPGKVVRRPTLAVVPLTSRSTSRPIATMLTGRPAATLQGSITLSSRARACSSLPEARARSVSCPTVAPVMTP